MRATLLWLLLDLTTVSALRPNFVIFNGDDLGFGDLGSFGHPTSHTPNIDKLASSGKKFLSLYAAAAVCGPSRTSLMTGRLPARACWDESCNASPSSEQGAGLPEDEVTVAAILRSAGYRTFMCGKWHLGYHLRAPWNHGFSDYYGVPLTNNECRSNLRGLGAETGCRHGAVGGPFDSCGPCPIFHYVNGSSAASPGASGIVEQGDVDMVNIDRKYADFASAFATEMAASNTPFLLYFASHHIHWPQFSMDVLNGSTLRGPVGDGLASFDWSVGQVMDAIHKSGIGENTLTFLTGDNGGYILTPDWNCGGTPAPGGTNGALRCGKGTTWEGGHRLPGIAHWPSRISPGTVSHQLVSHLDLLPTLCALAEGCELPAGRTLDGVDVSSLLLTPSTQLAPPSPRKAFFYYATSKQGLPHVPLMAARVGEYKAHWFTAGWGAYGPWGTDAVEMSAGVADPACHAELQYHSLPLIYNVARDVGEYVPIGNETTEYTEALRAILMEVEAHNKTMEYRTANPAKANTTGCYVDARTSKINCFPCASMGCEPKPLCCKTNQ